MNPINRVVLSRREFPDKNDLYEAVFQQIRLLLESGYTLVATKDDELGDCIAIDYSFTRHDDDWPRPFWLMKNEMIDAANTHIQNEVENAKTVISTAERADKFMDDFLDQFKGKGGGNNDGGNFEA